MNLILMTISTRQQPLAYQSGTTKNLELSHHRARNRAAAGLIPARETKFAFFEGTPS
jgi:hypothetical protein